MGKLLSLFSIKKNTYKRGKMETHQMKMNPNFLTEKSSLELVVGAQPLGCNTSS